MSTVELLKSEGHRLLDEYKVVAKINTAKAYEALKVKMKGKTWHFGQMHDKLTLQLAVGHLKKMITAKKYEQNKTEVAV